MPRPPWKLIAILGVLLTAFAGDMARAAAGPVIAAAADLQFALAEIAQRFTQESGKSVRLSFGSSGNFYRQIQQGAPFQVYLSADEAYPLALARQGLALNEGVLYAIGRIVILVPHGSPLQADAELKGLAAALTGNHLRRFAIANPEHAPYGRAAQAALAKAALWDPIQPFLVLGENAAQATQFATAGAAQGGIVPLSLARSPQIAKRGKFALIAEDWHPPLRQRMVLLKNAGHTAQAFYRYLQTPPAREVFRRYGFTLPGEEE